jgi:3-deoxy-D-arabino-heptulosonate 7-phosphate (DAHP) synthase
MASRNEGLKIMRAAADEYGLLVMTEVMEVSPARIWT